MVTTQGGSNLSLSSLRQLLRHHHHHHHHHHHQRSCHAFAHGGHQPGKTLTQILSDIVEPQPKVARIVNWKDSRQLGINNKVIPHGPRTVMSILRKEGFDAYLVGGCVRDLLLKKTPKDFDVITTATLEQLTKKFHRAEVVGARFPICVVHIKDSVTEVSSFETVAKNSNGEEENRQPSDCSMTRDFILKENSKKRDFTINSLFFDPFSNKVYDYSNGMVDLRSFQLRTIIPAKVSFEEDSARILRGLRIAARLGLSFSKETEAALHDLSLSITRLAKARLLMEVNYMFSYGAAQRSLRLLQRFNLLEILLPKQAVYLEQQRNTGPGQNSSMLMKLLSNLDKMVSCEHPCDCRLWVGLLAFHLALVHRPQDWLVVTTLASILYHGEWKEGVRHAKENAQVRVHFEPELSGSFESRSDEELAGDVSKLASFVQKSVLILIDPQFLLESLSKCPTSSSSTGLVFIPWRIGDDAAELFQMMVKQTPSCERRRKNFSLDYQLLGKRNLWEARFALGKIILETMGCKTLHRRRENRVEKGEEVGAENSSRRLSNLVENHVLAKKPRRNGQDVENVSKEKKKQVLNAGELRGSAGDMKPGKRREVIDESSSSSSKSLVSFVETLEKRRTESRDERASEKKVRDAAMLRKGEAVAENEKEYAQKEKTSKSEDDEKPLSDEVSDEILELIGEKVTEENNNVDVKSRKRMRKHNRSRSKSLVTGAVNEEEIIDRSLTSAESVRLPNDNNEVVAVGRKIYEDERKRVQGAANKNKTRPLPPPLSSLFGGVRKSQSF